MTRTLSAFGDEHRAVAPLLPLSIDISCLPSAQQQTRHILLLWSNDGLTE